MQLQRAALAFVVVDQNNCLAHVASAQTRECTGDVPQARVRGLPQASLDGAAVQPRDQFGGRGTSANPF